jgi:uncharacterized membrane protein YoaK (UPF0700 family)
MSKLSPILEASIVHDRRMLSVWLTVTFSAGMVNTLTLLACQRFVTHVTGTLTQIGADYARPLLLLDYLLVTLSFVLGAMLSYRLIDGRRVRGKEPWPTVPLFLVSGALTLVAGCGLMGVFGPFGQTVETSGDFMLLAILAFSMGLQNASVATTTGMIVRTTHMTGPLTDFAIALGAYLSPAPPSIREAARTSASLRGMKICSFVVGCAAAAVIGPRLHYLAYCVPATLVAVAGWWLRTHLQLLVPADEAAEGVPGGPLPA